MHPVTTPECTYGCMHSSARAFASQNKTLAQKSLHAILCISVFCSKSYAPRNVASVSWLKSSIRQLLTAAGHDTLHLTMATPPSTTQPMLALHTSSCSTAISHGKQAARSTSLCSRTLQLMQPPTQDSLMALPLALHRKLTSLVACAVLWSCPCMHNLHSRLWQFMRLPVQDLLTTPPPPL